MVKLKQQENINTHPLVSICIPTYNAAKTLPYTLKSIVNQSYSKLEIIVVDNASTDETGEIVKDFMKKYDIKYHRNNENIGPVDNLSRCIELANGEYTAIFHADDYYKPDIIKKEVEAFQENPSVGAVFTLANFINENNKLIGESPPIPPELKDRAIYYSDILISTIKNPYFLITPSALVKSEIYKQLAEFNGDKFGTAADFDMWLRISEIVPITVLNEKLICYRLSNKQGTYQQLHLRTEQTDFTKLMDYHLYSKSKSFNIPQDAIDHYELIKKLDSILFAANFIIKGQITESKRLLKEIITLKTLNKLLLTPHKTRFFRFLSYYIFGVILFTIIYMGIGKYSGKILYWFLYKFYAHARDLMHIFE